MSTAAYTSWCMHAFVCVCTCMFLCVLLCVCCFCEWVWDLRFLSQFLSSSLWASASRSLWNRHTHRNRDRDTEFTFNYSLTSQGQISRACLQLKQKWYSRGYISSRVTLVQSSSLFVCLSSTQCHPFSVALEQFFHHFVILLFINIMWLHWVLDPW